MVEQGPRDAGAGARRARGLASIGDPYGAIDAAARVDAGAPADGAGPDAPTACDGDAEVEVEGRCYMYFFAQRSWDGARAACVALGADLAEASSQAENDLLLSLTVDNPGFREVWLGGSDRTAEGTFAWLSGAAMTYTFWAAGEPNASAGATEDCLALRDDQGGVWNDEVCEGGLSYLCER